MFYVIIKPKLGESSVWLMTEEEFTSEEDELREAEYRCDLIIHQYETEEEASKEIDKVNSNNRSWRYLNNS